jgi:mono/diheme cytochrome c family protein
MKRYTTTVLLTFAASTLLTVASLSAAAVDTPTIPAKPTFSRDVAPIFFDKCVSCHQPNDVAPMSLRTYAEVRPWAKSIGKYVKSGEMPPWDADPGFGPFINDRSLTPAEIETVVRWAKKGAPEGDAADLPALPPIKEAGWRLGEPDYIIELEPRDVPAEGADLFRNVIHQTSFDEDKWITAVEVLPGDSSVLHHVLLWQGKEGGGSTPSTLIGGWAAGAEPDNAREGTGRLLLKGSPLIGDMHYHPSGKAATDVTRIGLHFSDDVQKEVVNQWIINADFEIPAGDPNYEGLATYTFAQDSYILNLTPHMHYRGKDFVYTATYPDGRTEELLRVSDYDFNWQTTYEFSEPIEVPAGTRVDCVAHWDNSKGNPDNPDPNKNVRFGNESFDEMMIGFVDYIVKDGVSPVAPLGPVEIKLAELAQSHPGQVWSIEQSAGEINAVLLPLEGDGGWFVPVASFAGRAPITEIVWNGDDVTAVMTPPGQASMRLRATLDRSTGNLELTVVNPDGSEGGTVTATSPN